MHICVLAACLYLLTVQAQGGPDDSLKKKFESENYTVTWGAAPAIAPDSILVIGRGNGHGGILEWLRFTPSKDSVKVLSVKYDNGRKVFKSKWPPDNAPIGVKITSLNKDIYNHLLNDLAIINSATLVSSTSDLSRSTNDIWVSVRLTREAKTLIDLDWAGYQSAREEAEFAKPATAINIVDKALKKLEFNNYALTKEDRTWASEKFAKDWTRFKDLKSYMWVRTRYLEMIGVAGDSSSLPALRDLLKENPPEVYYAINAVTRLVGKDVRDKPVEEMDIEINRRKLLEVLKDIK